MTGASFKHGTLNGYTNHKCRCDACRIANREGHRISAARARKRAAENPDIVPHGTPHGYGYWGCRCEPCAQASLDALRIYTGVKNPRGMRRKKS